MSSTVAIGAKITAANYNDIQSTIAPVLGVGSGQTGYGQTITSSAISIANKIKVKEWRELYADILACYNHQNSSDGSLTYPTTTIRIQAADYNAYSNMANSCVTNKDLFNSGYFSASSPANNIVLGTENNSASWGAGSRSTVIFTYTVTFASDDQARYYFNAGGQIRFNLALPDGFLGPPAAPTKDYSWQSTLNQMGTVIFGASSTYTLAGATSPGTGSSIGYRTLTSSDQTIYTKSTSTYIPNDIKIKARTTTGSQIMVFDIYLEDLNVSSDPIYGIDELLIRDTTSSITLRYASGVGQVTVNAPSVSTSSSVTS